MTVSFNPNSNSGYGNSAGASGIGNDSSNNSAQMQGTADQSAQDQLRIAEMGRKAREAAMLKAVAETYR